MLLELYYVTITLPPYRGPCDSFECPTTGLAKLKAGELLAEHFEHAPLVLVYRRERVIDGKTIKPRKWHAKLRPNGDVRFDLAGEDTPGETFDQRERDRVTRYGGHMARVGERRQRHKTAEQVERDAEKRQRAHKLGKGRALPVVCFAPIASFASATDAATWAGISQPAISRALTKGYRAGRFRFEYAAKLLKELQDEEAKGTTRENHAALKQAAEHALSLRVGKEVQAVPRAGAGAEAKA